MSRTLIVLPDHGPTPILTLLHAAKASLRLKMFAFDDPALLGAVVAARQRGVAVRVLFNRPGRGGSPDNAAARAALQPAGAEVADASHKLSVVHEKSLVVDEHTALVQSADWSTAGLVEARDYAVLTTHRHEVEEIAACFDADWERKHFNTHARPHLLWCPIDGRERIAAFIDDARHTLVVQNERYQDPVIIERLIRAVQRGVRLHLMAHAVHRMNEQEMATDVGGLRILDDVGVQVRRLRHLRLHANMMLADEARAIVGSINFSPASLDRRRELAIWLDDRAIVKQLHATAMNDWDHSHPIDLSEEGLREEGRRYGKAEDAEHLAHEPLDEGDAAVAGAQPAPKAAPGS